MDYSEVTNEEFDDAVRTVAHDRGTGCLLDIPGVWEIVCEALNNDALNICPSVTDDVGGSGK